MATQLVDERRVAAALIASQYQRWITRRQPKQKETEHDNAKQCQKGLEEPQCRAGRCQSCSTLQRRELSHCHYFFNQTEAKLSSVPSAVVMRS
jgi:hypothetical protein